MRSNFAFVLVLSVITLFSCSENKVEQNFQITKVTYSDNSSSITTSTKQDSKDFTTIFINSNGEMSRKLHNADYHEIAVTWAIDFKKQLTPAATTTNVTTSSVDEKGEHSRTFKMMTLASNN